MIDYRAASEPDDIPLATAPGEKMHDRSVAMANEAGHLDRNEPATPTQNPRRPYPG
ncbi:MAG TPA: hypothetical protein VMY69_02765 [Phycisphaerae bacterium]|nr:hypothetical protein [Phycisphaerae bacterium]